MPLGKKIYHFSSQEISGLFQSARRTFRGPYFDILRIPARYDHGRLLAIAAKRIGNAPQRNKIRRQLKAMYYEHRLYEKPYDFIVLAKKEIFTLDFKTLQKLILEHLV